jgi:hypothetical protein
MVILLFTVATTLNPPETLVPAAGWGDTDAVRVPQNGRKMCTQNKRLFLRLTHFKLLTQLEGAFLKLVIFARGDNFDSSNRGPKSLATPLVPATTVNGVASQKTQIITIKSRIFYIYSFFLKFSLPK